MGFKLIEGHGLFKLNKGSFVGLSKLVAYIKKITLVLICSLLTMASSSDVWIEPVFEKSTPPVV